MKIALTGNPNTGKTTLFNVLTKSNQKIGNWPGVTIEKKEGVYFRDKSIEIIDLPGIYSLQPISDDEKAACKYLETSRPDAVINVIDSINLERGLFLALQLLETDIPVVLALNMEDELKLNGLTLDIAAIEKELQVSAVLISAKNNKNISKLMDGAIAACKQKRRLSPFFNEGKEDDEKAQFRHIYISGKINSFRVKTASKAKKITERIDKIVLNKYLAFPIFFAVIFLMYFVSVQTIGKQSVDFTNFLFRELLGESLRAWLAGINSKAFFTSLIVDGILGGVSAVFAFIPQILILFLFITFLETSGYMARVAVIMDRLFKGFGLSGKSFIPMIIGCGCSVPAIMSSNAVDGDAEKKATIMLTPFIPCSAKLPLFALLAGALFPSNPFIAPSMYFLGIFMVIMGALILKSFRKKPAADMFLIELPHYRLPKFK
ncbi:MAG: ferrous iron transporter B, partial [Firmicutes bacterium]|nr:ferrous iron transporter B [Bacillota bacterium]